MDLRLIAHDRAADTDYVRRPSLWVNVHQRDRHHVLAAAEQINFDEVGVALDNLLLFAQIVLPTAAWRLVGGTDDFNDRHDTVAAAGVDDLDVTFGPWLIVRIDEQGVASR